MKNADLLLLLDQKATRISSKRAPTARFRERAYRAVISRIRQNADLDAEVDAQSIKALGLTAHMTDKLIKWIEQNKRPHAPNLVDQLTALVGLGAAKAHALVKAGLKSIDELEQDKWLARLPEETRLDLKYKPIRRIPHELLAELAPLLEIDAVAGDYEEEDLREKVDMGISNRIAYSTTMVGSYRRKAPFSKDVDIMLVSDTKEAAIEAYLKYLCSVFPETRIYSRGPDKLALLLVLGDKTIKIDVFATKPASHQAMLLYSTGSKAFNIRMRAIAKRKGLLLNQNGLFKGKKKLPIESERGFFDELEMEWLEPEARN
jgi:DNA polymerase (family 10)